MAPLNKPQAPDEHAQVLEAERALYTAQIAGSVEEIRPLLAADLAYLHSTGVAESRDGYLAGIANRLYEYGEITTRERRIQLFPGIAIVNGVVEMTVSARGAPKQLIRLLFCLVWIREEGAWRLSFRQATRIP